MTKNSSENWQQNLLMTKNSSENWQQNLLMTKNSSENWQQNLLMTKNSSENWQQNLLMTKNTVIEFESKWLYCVVWDNKIKEWMHPNPNPAIKRWRVLCTSWGWVKIQTLSVDTMLSVYLQYILPPKFSSKRITLLHLALKNQLPPLYTHTHTHTHTYKLLVKNNWKYKM